MPIRVKRLDKVVKMQNVILAEHPDIMTEIAEAIKASLMPSEEEV